MKRSTAVLALMALTLAACGGGGPGNTPEATYEAARRVVADKDWDGLLEFIPPSEWEENEKEFKAERDAGKLSGTAADLELDAEAVKTMSYRDFMVKMLEVAATKKPEQLEKIVKAEVVETKIDGDKATITTKIGDKKDEVRLVKENGVWYMKDF